MAWAQLLRVAQGNAPKLNTALLLIHNCDRLVGVTVMAPREISETAQNAVKKFAQDIINTERERHVTCPITYDLFKDPVFCCGDGYTYEREVLETHFGKGKTTSPLTGAELESFEYYTNYAMRSQADALRRQDNKQPGERSRVVGQRNNVAPIRFVGVLQKKIQEFEEALHAMNEIDDDVRALEYENGLEEGHSEARKEVYYEFWSNFKKVFANDFKQIDFKQKFTELNTLLEDTNADWVLNRVFEYNRECENCGTILYPWFSPGEYVYDEQPDWYCISNFTRLYWVKKGCAADYLRKLEGSLLEAEARLQEHDELLSLVEPDLNTTRADYNKHRREQEICKNDVDILERGISRLKLYVSRDA